MAGGEALIDCDVHAVVPSIATLEPHLDDHWREVIATSQFKGPTDSPYPPSLSTSLRPGLDAVDGQPPGATLASVREQVLDPLDAELAILTCSYGVESVRNPDAAAAIARAINDWLAAEFLDREPRLRASIVVPSTQPAMAAEEIARRAADPRFVQVYLPVRSPLPYGNRNWWPLLDAAAAHDLPLALHFGGATGLPPTASGWPTYYIEDYVDMATAFQSQLTSLIAEGAFDRHPALRVVLVESGFAWLPAWVWRFDKVWRGLRREVPWNTRPPSQVIREQVRLTLQPVDGPPDPAAVRTVIDQLGSDELLLFSSDYPHGHLAEGRDALPAGPPPSLRRAILSENARAFYRLGGDRHS
jgi:predicted TIM-barrel fold metal-dependent hydrolase